jgi:hypothetical protein
MQITLVVGFGLRLNGYSICVYSAAYITGGQRAERPCVVLRFEIQEISPASRRAPNKIRVSCVLMIFETVIAVSGYERCRETFCLHIQNTSKHGFSKTVFPRNGGSHRSTATVDHVTYKRHISINLIPFLSQTYSKDGLYSSPCYEIHIYNFTPVS